jgi:hypothetical protein
MPESSASAYEQRIADRLAAARQRRFVGREAEIALFRSALAAGVPPFVVLHVFGPGGVGKTTLLREFGRVAAECGRPVVRLDGRNLDPSPPGVLLALHEALGQPPRDGARAVSGWPPDGVLLIDTYETMAALDTWLREAFLPQLSARSIVVIAGRNAPDPAWRSDLEWAGLARIIALRNLQPEESRTFLAMRGISHERYAEALAFTHGHPLALSLVADVLSQEDRPAAFDPRAEPDVLRMLLERFVHDVPSALHRQALDICVLAWATTEGLLKQIIGEEQAHTCFEWLRGLSFVEQGAHGLFPHDLVREVLDADLRWRNREAYRDLHGRVADYLHRRVVHSAGVEQQRLRLQVMYVSRHDPGMKSFFAWDAIDSVYAEPAAPEDAAAIVEMVQAHEGDQSASIARYWLRRQPAAFLVFRNLDGELFGFMAHLELHAATPGDMAADPALPAVLSFAERTGPAQPGQEIVFLRFWMERNVYQAVSPALNLTAINCTNYWLTHRQLAWNFLTMSDPDFMQPHFASINIRRSPEADFEIGGRRYGVFSHDWRAEPAKAWRLRMRHLGTPTEPQPPKSQARLLVLSEPEFAEAARKALRDYQRPDLLAANPLAQSYMAREAAAQANASSMLQALLREAVDALAGNSRDQKLHRALWHTYFEPAPTQEQAAQQLDLPFSTYRRHLTGGIQRVVDWLWRRELNAQQ